MNLSIITICYNIADTIERTLTSIANQSFQDFEWIVVDGASSDGTLDIIKKYQNRINILISEKDSGIYNAMNKGIKVAHGDFILFLNGGDSFISNQSLNNALITINWNYDIISCSVLFKYENNVKSWITIKYPNLFVSSLPHESTFIRKSLFEQFGLYDETYKISADYEWFVRTIIKYKAKYINNYNFLIYFYKDGISSIANKKRINEDTNIRKKYFQKSNFIISNIRIAYYIDLIKKLFTHPIDLSQWIWKKITFQH